MTEDRVPPQPHNHDPSLCPECSRIASEQPAPLDVAVRALETIKRDEGKVCEQYETCTHLACSSSYSAWAIADATLRHIARLGSAPSRSEPE